LAKPKRKREVSPEAARQAAAMKARLEQLAAQRKEQEDAQRGRGGHAGGGWAPGGVDPQQIRSGRRGNR
jgi:hypothetical protein